MTTPEIPRDIASPNRTSPYKRRPEIISLPIFWQVLGLGLCVMILGFAINTLVVLKAPEPPPSGYSLTEAAQALKAGQVRLPNGHILKSITSATPPAYVTAQPANTVRQSFQRFIATRLAAALNVPADTVWISIERPQGFRGRNRDHDEGPRGPFDPGHGGPAGPNGPPPFEPSASAFAPGPNGSVPDPTHSPPVNPAPNPDPNGPPMSMGAPGEPAPGMADSARIPHHHSGLSFFESPNARMRFPNSAESQADAVFPAFNAAWKLKDGRYRLINAPRDLIQPWQTKLLWGIGLTTLAILPLVYLLSQRLTRPIIAFSEAAAKIGVEDDAPPILAIGPREVRAAADVVNAMQSRIKKQVQGRTALMAAIAHDLKTPLARMRLRIEDVPEPLRDKLSGDIAHMDDLIRSAMSFASAHKMSETLRPLDLSTLADSLCEDLSPLCELGPSLIESNVRVRGDSVALKRIMTNLIENAGRYAGSCRIELSSRGRNAELRIIDTGPGLPEEALEAVFDPFYRLESSRNRDTGGTGLGLSVARALTEAQGGTLTLKNRYEGAKLSGLEALLVLPLL